MANKDGAKPRKIVDVAAPGKAEPSATSRPIIVTNRPMIKRDPMMTPTDADTDTPDALPEANRPISRVARTIKVIPSGTTEPAADEAEPTPVEEVNAAEQSKPAKDGAKPSVRPIAIKHVDQSVALEIGLEAVGDRKESAENPADAKPNEPTPEDKTAIPVIPIVDSSSGEETVAEPEGPARLAVDVSMPTEDEAVVVPVVTGDSKENIIETKESGEEQTKAAVEPFKPDAAVEPKPEAQPTPETADAIDKSTAAEAEGATAAASPTTTPAPTTEPEADDDSASADDDTTDEQLPANQALEDEQRKKDEAAAQVIAEQEKIIASKRYYLPIKPRSRRRGVVRAVIALIIVILLSLVWLDVVLDAGIVHIGGLHALTHFF